MQTVAELRYGCHGNWICSEHNGLPLVTQNTVATVTEHMEEKDVG